MLPQFILDGLQTAVNNYLQLDPEAFKRIDKLEKKVIAIKLKGAAENFYIQPSAAGLVFFSHYDGNADTCLEGSLFSLMSLGLQAGTHSTARLFGDDLSITGDVEFGQEFKEVLDSIEIDWEYYLSYAVGGAMAHQLVKTFNQFTSWTKQTAATMVQNTKEFLQEEHRDLPPREEFEDFCEDVVEVLMAVDRLNSRIEQLRNIRETAL